MISLRGVTKIYTVGNQRVAALNGVDVDIKDGEFLSIMGPSGSGKSTLMNIVGCLDRQTEGEIRHVVRSSDGVWFLETIGADRGVLLFLRDNDNPPSGCGDLEAVLPSFEALPAINAISVSADFGSNQAQSLTLIASHRTLKDLLSIFLTCRL